VGAELEEMIGARIARTYRVENHVAKTHEMTDLGEIAFVDEGAPPPPLIRITCAPI
jgi:hypothetical protein